ncbi:MAG: DUF4912 domain-containing protein [Planctomycetales bacterium]|nr:DUF4912 domain-containing protein [Planctomycetales bacterium]
MTAEQLNECTVRDLAQMAKRAGVNGWHSMRKAQLVSELTKLRRTSQRSNRASSKSAGSSSRGANSSKSRATRRAATKSQGGANTSAKSKLPKAKPLAKTRLNGVHAKNGAQAKKAEARKSAKPRDPAVERRLRLARQQQDRLKNLAYDIRDGKSKGNGRDRIVVMVRDPYWLHAYWEVCRRSVERAQAALGEEWHGAKPALRLLRVTDNGESNSAECVERYIDIHGGVNNWYIDVPDPPKTYRVEVGYLAESGRFHVLSRSNVVSTPKPGTADTIDENWADVADQFDKIYAMSGGHTGEGPGSELQEIFEERLRRPMGSPLMQRYAAGLDVAVNGRRPLDFELDAELIVFGKTRDDARVTLQGDPVEVRSDGTFTVRCHLPNSRQVIPVVSTSADGVEQRTIVLAVQRNTKEMEPRINESSV